MPIEESLRSRISDLLTQAPALVKGDEHFDRIRSAEHKGECVGWIIAAQNAVSLVCPSSLHPYRSSVDAQAIGCHIGNDTNHKVAAIAGVLRSLLIDVESGLVATVANRARAEVFDDFLGHAEEYIRKGRKNESGAIAGVVFEDTVRRICDKRGIPQRGENLDKLITELERIEVFTGTKSKRARASAHVRTKATHAQWDEFDLRDVSATIEFTHELTQLLEG